MPQAPLDEDLVQAYIDGLLTPRETAHVAARLAADPALRARVEAEQALTRTLGAQLGTMARDLGEWDDLTTDQLARDLERHIRSVRRHAVLRQACAAVVLIGLGWFGNQAVKMITAAPTNLQIAAAAHEYFAHSAYAVAMTDISEKDMEAWLGAELGEAIDIPDLSAIHLTLVSSRVIQLDDGPLAQALYRDRNNNEYSFYIAPGAAPDASASLQMAEVDGLNAGYWRDGDLLLTVVADDSEDAVRAVALEIADADSIGAAKPSL